MDFSLLMPVHCAANPVHLRDTLASVATNSVRPCEVVIVWDGNPGESLREAVDSFSADLSFRMVTCERSIGLGPALARGLAACNHEWVARIDGDDICTPDRFERQLQFIRQNPSVDAFSSPLLEFSASPDTPPLRLKNVPLRHEQIVRYARWRNPLNHPAVMMRRSAVLRAGNYGNERHFEDYSLWVRMILSGARLANMEQPVVFARAGKALQHRRGGMGYVLSEIAMLRRFRQWGFISTSDLLTSVILKPPIRLMPAFFRDQFYNLALRVRAQDGLGAPR